MKKITLLTTGILCAVGMATGVVANGVIKEIKAQLRPDFTIKIDGETVKFKDVEGDIVHPILHDGTTYLPVRAIGEMMGKTVYWYEDEKRIELKEDKTTVTDADVIIGSGETVAEPDAKEEKDKQKPEKTPKPEKKPDKKTELPDKADFIGEEKAKKIALEKAELAEADVIFIKAELDKDDGVWNYDVEFKKGNVEYEAEIAAVDGKIIAWEVDIDD